MTSALDIVMKPPITLMYNVYWRIHPSWRIVQESITNNFIWEIILIIN